MINIVEARETVNQHREQIVALLSLDEYLHGTPTVILKEKPLSHVCYPHVFPHGTKCLSIIEQMNKTLARCE